MHKWMSIALGFGMLLAPLELRGKELDDQFDLTALKGHRLGYYIGSFDPIHRGHEGVIQEALDSGEVDYVLIYPVPGGDQFKNRTDWAIRRKMVASVYRENPKVFVTAWSPKKLLEKFAPIADQITVIGIIGSDVVTENLLGPDEQLSEKYRSVFMRGLPLKEKHYADTIGALMALKAEAFLVALRGGVDLSYLNRKIADRPIHKLIQSRECSSTQVRRAIQNGEPFESLVSFSVQAIIKQEGLYGYPSRLNPDLQNELIEMQRLDQEARARLIDLGDSEEDAWQEVDGVDERNGARLRTIIALYGWPGISLVGADGAQAAWLLVQHQDRDLSFQKQCRELLEQAVQHDEAAPRQLAYLTDRINMNEGKPQLYGTQWLYQEGDLCIYPVEDPEGLDARRAEVGLMSIAEYERLMRLELS